MDPAFDEPSRVSTAGSESLGGNTTDRGRRNFGAGRDAVGELAEDGIDEWSCGTFPSALDEFNALIDGGAGGNAAKPTELVNRKAERCENLEIELGEWLCRGAGDLGIKQRSPAQNTHD